MTSVLSGAVLGATCVLLLDASLHRVLGQSHSAIPYAKKRQSDLYTGQYPLLDSVPSAYVSLLCIAAVWIYLSHSVAQWMCVGAVLAWCALKCTTLFAPLTGVPMSVDGKAMGRKPQLDVLGTYHHATVSQQLLWAAAACSYVAFLVKIEVFEVFLGGCEWIGLPVLQEDSSLKEWLLWCMLFSLGSCGTYITACEVFERVYYHNGYQSAVEWKVQPYKWLSEKAHRFEVQLSVPNALITAPGMSLCMIYLKVYERQLTVLPSPKVYYDQSEHSLQDILLAMVPFYVWTDFWAYFVHRILHWPVIYRNVHKLHHRFTAPTPYSALALHPIELMSLQFGIYAYLLVMPIHFAVLVFIFIYLYVFTVIDHSGIKVDSVWFAGMPFQPSTRFHDDHHALFHLNYGQSMVIWDWMFGSLRQPSRMYGETVFQKDQK